MNIQSILHLIPKDTYYNSKKEIVLEGTKSHKDLFEEDRLLYTYLLYFQNATYFSKSLMIKNVLANSIHKPENAQLLKDDSKLLDIETALIRNALFNENTTHAIKMLLSLKDKRVNNSRTTKIIVDFVFNRGNSDFIVIKYKKKIKDLLIHAFGLRTVNSILNREEAGLNKFSKTIGVYNNPFALEVFDFAFDVERDYTSPYLKEYVRVRELFKTGDNVRLTKETPLPIEVLGGFNNFYKRGLNITELLSFGNVSEKQKIQLQNSVKKASNNKVEIKVDLTKYSIMELQKYMYNKIDIEDKEIKECIEIIHDKAKELRNKVKDNFMLDLSTTAVIVDVSDSHFGSDESSMHPMYKNLALAEVFKGNGNTFLVGGSINEKGLIVPSGNSNLSDALLEAVKKGFKNVIVLSDGFENVYSFDKVFKQLNTLGFNINAVHFNPVFSPKNFSFKSLSDSVITIPFNSVDDIESLMLFYQFGTDKEKFKEVMRNKIETELLA